MFYIEYCNYYLYTLSNTVDMVTIDASEYRVHEASEVVNITLSRTGDLLDDIIIPFRAHHIPDMANSAIRE